MIADTAVPRASSPPGIPRTVLLVVPMALLSGLFLYSGSAHGEGGQRDAGMWLAFAANYIFVNVLWLQLVRTGKTDRYRAILFITMAVTFVMGFIPNLLETRGNIGLTEEDMINGKTPFCHIVIPMTLIPAALTRTIIFPGSIREGFASIATMFVLWIGASLALGRGFCSWGCFFGGLDEGFARIRRRSLIKRIDEKWTYLPYAMLVAMVLISAATLSPTYCEWLCPFKTVTEFDAVTSLKTAIQAVIFVSLFLALVVVLPILTRRRTQCGLFCPLGALQALIGKAAPFDVRVQRDRCGEKCTLCVQECPSFALNQASLERGGTRLTCSLCGKCVDQCPKRAIGFHIRGTPAGVHPERARLLYMYAAFLFLVIFSSGQIQGAVYRLFHLATTGSYLLS